MAEAIFKHQVKQRGLEYKFKVIDSFGVSAWHNGQGPDERTVAVCQKYGVPIDHKSQKISGHDYSKFDYLLAMDLSHEQDLLLAKPKHCKTKIKLFGEWKTDNSIDKIVDDPYYGDMSDFEYNFQQLSHFTKVFLDTEVS